MAEDHDLRGRAAPLLAALTPHPHRGPLIAAGAVPLTVGVLLVNLRLDAQWGTGVFLVLDALACALVLGMGVLAPSEGDRPRSYQQVLLLCGLLLAFVTLLRVAQVLGADQPLGASGSRTWIFALITVAAAWLAHALRSAIFAGIAGIAGIVATLSFVDWAFSPDGFDTPRWVLLALALGLVLTALSQRERRPRESVYLIDAAGIAIVLLGATFVAALFLPLQFLGLPGAAPGGGWKLVLLAAGLGLIAYAGVDRESGPAYVGITVLLLFVALAALPGEGGASLWFWPLALLLAGGAMIVAGLRPRRPLPPEPSPGGPPAEPVPGPGSAERSSLWASPGDGGSA